jgi:cold shock CspA family protein
MTHQGMIIAFRQTGGWGFIKDVSGEEWFFHMANAVLTIPTFLPELGAQVEFELRPPFRLGQKDQAVNVRKAGGAL